MSNPKPERVATSAAASSVALTLKPVDNERLANLCGQFDEHLRLIERRLGVEINNRGADFNILGHARAVQATAELLRDLYRHCEHASLNPQTVHLFLQESGIERLLESGGSDEEREFEALKLRRGVIRGRGAHQIQYLQNIRTHDLNFGVGPAGTGKTYLAVAAACEALEADRVRRLVLVRPAVEAGERLGFLPGDLAQKIDPYLRPMYDALYEMLGFEKVARLQERNVIEVAPLAYMRGRTLNDAFVILDEAQNTTPEQMKMFLTRIGFGSTAVVNGDVTQTDLPRSQRSGLRQVLEILQGVQGVSFTFFNSRDVVRHPLVQRIVEAYDASERPMDSTDGH